MCGNCSCSANKRAGYGSATRRAGAPSFFIMRLPVQLTREEIGWHLRKAAESYELGYNQLLQQPNAWWLEQGAVRHEPPKCGTCQSQQGEQDHMS